MQSRVRYLCIRDRRRGVVYRRRSRYRMLPAAGAYRRRGRWRRRLLLQALLDLVVDVRWLALDDRQGRVER